MKTILVFFIELIHGIGMLFPFAIYFIDMPKWIIIFSLIVQVFIPFLWFISDDKCFVSDIASDLTNDSRIFSEKYLWWLYKHLKIFLSKNATKEEIVNTGVWSKWFLSVFLIWFYIFIYNNKKFC